MTETGRNIPAAIAALAAMLLTAAGLYLGWQLMTATGAATLSDTGRLDRLDGHADLRLAIEAIKLALAALAACLILAVHRRLPELRTPYDLVIGFVSVALLAASALIVLSAHIRPIFRPEVAEDWAFTAGMFAVLTHGLWAALASVTAWKTPTLPRWLCMTGGALAVSTEAASIMNSLPLEALTAVTGFAWLGGLSAVFALSGTIKTSAPPR